MALQHLRSSTADKRPTPGAMSDGQLAVNTNAASTGLFFKDSAGALVKVGPVHVGTTAPNASPAVGGQSGNTVGEQWLDTTGGTYVFKVWDGSAWRSEAGEFVNSTGDTMTGDLTLDNANIVFEGSTADTFETTLTVADPTADNTITLPNVSGTVVTTGDTGSVTSTMIADATIVNADISASAEIAVSKLADGTARQLLQTDAAGTGVEWTSNVDVPGTLDVTGAATLDSTLGVTGQSTLASAAVSDLTSGRVVLAGTSGELEDSAALTFNGTQFDVDGDVVITGDLTVEGASTILETETVKVEDKNIELGVVASPTDVTADGGGITLKGTTDKTINWVDATDAWTFSEHVDIASAKDYRIAGTKVLDATSLGSGVVSSSLTSVGTIGTGAWQATAIGVAYGGTGQTTYTDGQLLIGNSTGNTLTKATLTADTGIVITNGSGTITLAIDSDTAIADITTTATTGTLPTADGSVTIAAAAAPTVGELLEYCVELEAKIEAALAALRTVGVIAT